MTLLKRFEKLSTPKKAVVVALFFLVLLFIFPDLIKNTPFGRPTAGQGEFYFASHATELIPGQTFNVELRVRSKANINAVGATLKFDPNLLEILNMNTEESFCSFYLDNSFDNIKGEVVLSCGKPNPGFQGDSTIMTLQVRGKTHGTTAFALQRNGSQILANDGKGTDVLNDYPSQSVTIKKTF